MAPFDGFSPEAPRSTLTQSESVGLKEPALTPGNAIDRDQYYSVEIKEGSQNSQDTVTFKDREGGEVLLPAYKIHSSIKNEDIMQHKELLASYLSRHATEYEELKAYSKKSFGKPFDLTLTPVEVTQKVRSQDGPLIGVLLNRLFGKSSIPKIEKVVTKKSDVNQETVALYSSIIADFLEHHPKVVAAIKNEYGIIIGTENRDEDDQIGIAV